MAEGENPAIPFAITGETQFTPRFFPETIRVTKERRLDRKQGVCEDEVVSDNGSKNRDIHISGRLRGEAEKQALDALGDSSDVLTVTSTTWSGDVRIANIEYEGPVGWHPPTGELDWSYTLDVVSTGRDEQFDLSDLGVSTVDDINI